MGKVAYLVVIAVFIIGAALIIRLSSRRSTASGGTGRVPPALRPGDTDDILEGDRLQKIQWLGAAASVLFAAFIAIYWLAEPVRMKAKEAAIHRTTIERGKAYFGFGEKNVEGSQVLGVECARCHGENQQGGTNEFVDPASGQKRTVKVPELKTVFGRYEKPPSTIYKNTREFIYETVERGRPGTDMPTWGNKYGGPLTEQQIDDVVNFLESIQEPLTVAPGADGSQIFAQFCSPCHGQQGVGGSGPRMQGGGELAQFPDINAHIAFVKAGSKAGVAYGTHGRGTGTMPSWEGKLTEEQIRAVIEYERSL